MAIDLKRFSSLNAIGSILSKFWKRGAYNFGTWVLDGATKFNKHSGDKEKLSAILTNPAAMKVFALQCDLFSLGEVSVENRESGEKLDNDPFLSLIEDPNPFQYGTQFLWDFMFWNMLGTDYCYVDSKNVEKVGNKMYHLIPHKIEFPKILKAMKDKIILADSTVKQLNQTMITYKYEDNTTFEFPFDRLILSFDLTNGIGNHFTGASRIDALYKIISNSEHVLDSQNINIRYSGKFLVGSPSQTGTNTKRGLNEDEKEDLRRKIDDLSQNVWPFGTSIELRRFVENLSSLQLREEYLGCYFLIGNMFNIPRDVLEAYNSATYENQEKARAAHVNYTLDPKGNQFFNAFERHFSYRKQGKNIKISWNHLPFMQVFEKEKAEIQQLKINSLILLLNNGVPLDEANQYLGTEFTIEDGQETS